MQRDGLMVLSTLYSVVSGTRKAGISRVRSLKAANNGQGKMQMIRIGMRIIRRSVMSSNSRQIPLVDFFIFAGQIVKRCHLPFHGNELPLHHPLFLLATELGHHSLLGSIIHHQSIIPSSHRPLCPEAQLHQKDSRQSKFERIVPLLAYLPLFYPFFLFNIHSTTHEPPSPIKPHCTILFSAFSPEKPSLLLPVHLYSFIFASCAASKAMTPDFAVSICCYKFMLSLD